MHVLPGGNQAVLQFAQRVLTGADYDVVYRQHLRLAFANADMQAVVVDAQVFNAVEHLHLFVLQTGPVNPAGGLAQTVAHFARLALQQEHLARRCVYLRLDSRYAAPCFKLRINTPFFPERFAIQAGGNALLHQELGYVKTNPARANHGNPGADRLALKNHVQIAQHLGVVDAGYGRGAGGNPGGQNDFVETACQQLRHVDTGVQANLNPGGLQLASEVAQGLKELFLARYTLGHVELATNLAGGVEQCHLMPALGRHGCR